MPLRYRAIPVRLGPAWEAGASRSAGTARFWSPPRPLARSPPQQRDGPSCRNTPSARHARREAHEPGVIFELFPRFALQEFVGGKLGGAGLAAHIEARELRADARAALVHHAVSSINHFGDIVRRKRPTVLLILAALDEVGLMPEAAVDEPAISARQLQGRHR